MSVKRSSPRVPFALEAVPPDLYSLITEKMPMHDIKTFNLGSKLTATICENLRCIEADLTTIEILERVEKYQKTALYRKTVPWTPLSTVPRKICLYTETLTMGKKCLNAIKEYRISADLVRFCGETAVDPEFIKEVMQLTGPEKIFLQSPTLEILTLDELKEMKSVVFRPRRDFSDLDLLAMTLDKFSVDTTWNGVFNITSDGVFRFIKQWFDGTRNITRIHFPFHNLDARRILREFNVYRDKNTKGFMQKMVLCKGDGTTECVVQQEWTTLKLYRRTCPGNH